jgi:hypothetical protein
LHKNPTSALRFFAIVVREGLSTYGQETTSVDER